MSTIDPRPGIQLALPPQPNSVRQRARAADAAGPTQPTPAAASASEAAASVLAQRIRAIAADDSDRRRKAVRVFLESELLRAFGEELVNDPQFAAMVDAVQEQMQEDPQTAAAAHAVADLLLARARG